MDISNVRRFVGILLALVFILAPSVFAEMPLKSEVLDTMLKVEDYWIHNHPDPGSNLWNRATHFEGTMALYSIYPDGKYYDYALNWSNYHNFRLPEEKFARIADSHCAGQIYLELNDYDPSPEKLTHVVAAIDEMVNSPENYYWWWIDALHMSMPVFAKLARLIPDKSNDYLEKMWELYAFTKVKAGGTSWTNADNQGQGLYSDNGHYNYGDYLWWEHYYFDPVEGDEPEGKMSYWSRGNGWVAAAHARTLKLLEPGMLHYDDYLNIYQEMAASLITRQRSDGFWNVELDYSSEFDVKETSGTAFFTYAIAWGINHHHLDQEIYAPYVEAAWNAMVNEAVHPDGKLGYVQGIGNQPVSEGITYESTSDFGVGAFMLAGSEVFKMAGGATPTPKSRIVLQAENATIFKGQIDNDHAGYTGSGFVNYDNETGSYVTFSFDADRAGPKSLLIRFANGSAGNRYMDINVNGGEIEHDNVPFNSTGQDTENDKWSSWGYQQVLIDLVAGTNTIQLIADQPDGGPNLDKIEIGRVIGGDDLGWYPGTDFSQVHPLYADNTETVGLEFDVTPLNPNIDGVIGYADSATDVMSWNSMAVLVRMFTNGRFEARNGATYAADADLYYSVDTRYHVRINVDIPAGTYDVWVAPQGEEEIKIADDFLFRSDAPPQEDIGKVCLIGATSNDFMLENHIIYSLSPWYSATDFTEVHDLYPLQGELEIQFDVTPMDSNIDGVIGYADSGTDITSWNSMAVLVRMFTNGRFEARNGATYAADADLFYSADTEYHVRINVDIPAGTYDVWVAPEGGDAIKIADDFLFRSDAPTPNDIGQVCLNGNIAGNFELRKHTSATIR